MGKTDKELAVELAIAQIQAASRIKRNDIQTGSQLNIETVSNLIKHYYKTLSSLDK